ncbi:MerR family transcriptional regulator [Streptomyces umbrinus]|nr:MerR family transcriptional regulator [Streptomyces umbrinus]
MDGGTLYSIGELARCTGLTVKTIRFYSDRGIVPPMGPHTGRLPPLRS